MKKTILFTLSIIFLLVINAEAVQLTIAYEDKEQPPYYMGNTKEVLKNPGVAVEMVQMLEKNVKGVKIKLVRMPWKRCTKQLEYNKVDGIFNASYKTGRLEIGWYPTLDKKHKGPVDTSRRITTISYSLYVLKSSKYKWDGKNYNIFKGKVGAPLGYSIVGDLKKKGLEVEEAVSSMINLNKLSAGRLIAVALQDVTGDSMIKANSKKFGNIVKLKPALTTKPYYLMLSDKFVKDNPAIAQKIWDAIRDIRKKQFEKLALKYSK